MTRARHTIHNNSISVLFDTSDEAQRKVLIASCAMFRGYSQVIALSKHFFVLTILPGGAKASKCKQGGRR